MQVLFFKQFVFVVIVSFVMAGLNVTTSFAKSAANSTEQSPEILVYTGKVLAKSSKVKAFSIRVDKGKKSQIVMVQYDDKTTGMEHISKGPTAIINYEKRDGAIWATVIKPRNVIIRKGTSEIKTDELMGMIDAKGDFLVVDTRPARMFTVAHIPGAVNIDTKKYKEQAPSVLPKDKNIPLVFYCTGAT